MALITPKYIFIHPYKTGGNSVRQILGQFDNKHEWGGVHIEASAVRFDILKSATQAFDNTRDAQQDFKVRWTNLFKFAFVRNPYDWNASLYYYIRGTNHGHQKEASGSYLNFLKWLTEEAMHFEKHPHSNKYLTLTEFLYDGEELLMDYVGYLENFDKDMAVICDKIGHPYKPIHANKTGRRKAWQDITNSQCTKIINQVFQKDFENFGYDMV